MATTEKKANPRKVITGKVRLSYCHLTEPRARNAKDEPKYSTALIIPKTDKVTMKALRAAEKLALEEGLAEHKFTQREVDLGKKSNGTKGVSLSIIKDGDEDADLERNPEYAGCWYMNVSAGTRKPGIVDRQLEPITDPTEIYSGCYVRASLTAFAYSNESKGVTFGLNHIQKIADGDPLGGMSRAEDDFDEMDDDDDDDVL